MRTMNPVVIVSLSDVAMWITSCFGVWCAYRLPERRLWRLPLMITLPIAMAALIIFQSGLLPHSKKVRTEILMPEISVDVVLVTCLAVWQERRLQRNQVPLSTKDE